MGGDARMTDSPDSYTQAELVRLVKGVQSSVDKLDAKLDTVTAQHVARSEWETWRIGHDREMQRLRETVAEAKNAAAPVKVSGWTIAAFGVTAFVGVGSLLGLTITLINVIP